LQEDQGKKKETQVKEKNRPPEYPLNIGRPAWPTIGCWVAWKKNKRLEGGKNLGYNWRNVFGERKSIHHGGGKRNKRLQSEDPPPIGRKGEQKRDSFLAQPPFRRWIMLPGCHWSETFSRVGRARGCGGNTPAGETRRQKKKSPKRGGLALTICKEGGKNGEVMNT